MKLADSISYRHGSIVHVRLWDARIIEAKVCYIEQTITARKVTVVSGSLLNRVDASQVIGVVRL